MAFLVSFSRGGSVTGLAVAAGDTPAATGEVVVVASFIFKSGCEKIVSSRRRKSEPDWRWHTRRVRYPTKSISAGSRNGQAGSLCSPEKEFLVHKIVHR